MDFLLWLFVLSGDAAANSLEGMVVPDSGNQLVDILFLLITGGGAVTIFNAIFKATTDWRSGKSKEEQVRNANEISEREKAWQRTATLERKIDKLEEEASRDDQVRRQREQLLVDYCFQLRSMLINKGVDPNDLPVIPELPKY